IRQHSVACLRHQIDAGGVRAHGVCGLPRDTPHHLLQLQGGSDRPPDAENRLRGTQAAAHLARRRRAIDGEGDAVSELAGAATLRVSDRGRRRVQHHQADDGVIADEGDEEHGADPEALPLVGHAGIRRDGDDQPGTPAAQHLHQDRRPLRADLRLERLEGLPEIGAVRTGRELGHGRNENVALRHEDRATIDRTRFGRDTGEAAEHRGEAWCQALPARELDLSKRDGAAVQKGPACVGGGVHAVVAGHHESTRRLRCTICGQAQRLAIDAARALRAPGVLAVFTGSDVAHLGTMKMLLHRKRPDGSPMFAPPHRGLTRERARYVGDPVAMVVAETLAQAEDAAEWVRIDYEPLPSVTSTAEAVGGPPVWDECPDNVSNVHEVGDRAATEAAFARAARVVRRRYVITRVHAQYMEARGAVGAWDPGEQRYTLHADVQYPPRVRTALAT